MTSIAERIIVVVPTLNEEKHIETCLESLGYTSDALAGAVFVVSDGGSSDRTREIVRDLSSKAPNLWLIDNPGKLQSAGVNAAIASEHSEGRDILVRCDAHAHYSPDYVIRLAETLLARQVASVVVAMHSVGTTCFGKAAAWSIETPFGSGGAAHRAGRASGFIDHGHHAAFDIGFFRKIGGYDPTFSHNEDAEYDYRLVQAGGKIWLEADIQMTYFMRPDPRGLARQYVNYGAGRMRTLLKHGLRPKLRQFLPILLAVIVIVSVAGGLLLHPVFLLGLGGYLGLVFAVSLHVLWKKRSVCALWVGPALAIMHLCWAYGASKTFWKRSRRGV